MAAQDDMCAFIVVLSEGCEAPVVEGPMDPSLALRMTCAPQDDTRRKAPDRYFEG